MDENNDSKKCCKGTKLFLMAILLLNTFFVGSIWCKVVMQPRCSLNAGKSGKFCPFANKGSKDAKGSTTDLKVSQQ